MLLAKGLHARGDSVRVMTFYAGGELSRELKSAGIQTIQLNKSGRWDILGFLGRLLREMRRYRPKVLYCFLPMASLLGVLVRLFIPGMRIVWGVRASNVDMGRYDKLTRFETYAASWLAHRADMIICNSLTGFEYYVRRGYPRTKMRVVENGIDTERFSFDEKGRKQLRRKWGIKEHEILIGIVGRLDPMKGHETFLAAAAMLVQNVPNVRFVCVGSGQNEYASRLHRLTVELKLGDKVLWMNSEEGVTKIYCALDIATSSSSYGEGFSNAVAEAMACERVSVVTDVGDSARIVGDNDYVVPPNDPKALATRWATLIGYPSERRSAIGRMARARIQQQFSVVDAVSKTVRALELW